jgi:MFS-type transporter involved in bile tolerance (Atg22 family)
MQAGLNSAGIIPLFFAPFLADAFGVQPVLFGASFLVALVAVAFLLASLRRR